MSSSVSYELFQTKSLLESVSLVSQSVAVGLAIPFDTNSILIGNAITHTIGSTDFNLELPGLYKVTFTGSAIPSVVNNTVSVAFAINGVIIPGTIVDETSYAGTAVPAALSTQAIVQVLPDISTVLTVINSGGLTEIFTHSNIILHKIG